MTGRMDVNFLLQTEPAHTPSPTWSETSSVTTPTADPRPSPPPSDVPPAALGMMELANAAAMAAAAQDQHKVPYSPVSSNSHYSVEDGIDRLSAYPPAPVSPSQPAATPTATATPARAPAPVPVHTSQPTSRTHSCGACGETFSLKVRFLHHLLTAHGVRTYEARTILPCAKCNAAFLRNTDRSKHDLCVHQRLRPFRCDAPSCSSSFFFAKDLSKHRSTVHLRHKPFLCSICPKAFGKREHMTSHVKRVHQKLRPFKCEVCDIRLASKYNLQGHLKTAAHAAAETLANRDGRSVRVQTGI